MEINESNAPMYKIDTRIRDKYTHGYKRDDSDVTHFIVHGTAGGARAESVINWMYNGGYLGYGKYRKSQYEKGVALFQYLIDRNGDVIEILNPHNFVYHSSTGGNSSKQTGFDKHTIGVELINSDRDNGGTYTELQYKSLVWLYAFLLERFPNMKHIYGHGAIKKEKTGKYKYCPGTGFRWGEFNKILVSDYLFNTVKNKEYIEVL